MQTPRPVKQSRPPSPVISARITRAARYAACADASSLLEMVGTDGRDLHAAYLRAVGYGMLTEV